MRYRFRGGGELGMEGMGRVGVVDRGMGQGVEERGGRLFRERDLSTAADGPCARGLLRVETYTYDAAEFTVQSESACVFYWADGYDRGWRARVNGRKSPVFRANVDFKAVVVPGGPSRVRFEYTPRRFVAGLLAFYGALGVSLIGALTSVVGMARRRNPRRASETEAKP